MRPQSLTNVGRTAVREPVRRQGVNARKHAVQRSAERRESFARTGSLFARVLRTWGAILLLLGVLAVGAFLLQREAAAKGWIALRTVRCRGCSLAGAVETARRGGLWQGIPLTTLSPSLVEARLAADPRFLSVSVRRSWPHGMVLTVTEDVPQVRDLRGRVYGTSGRSLGPVPSAGTLPLLEDGVVSREDLALLLAGLDTLHRREPNLWRHLRSLRPVPDGMDAKVDGVPTGLLLPLRQPGDALHRAAWLYSQLGETSARLSTMDFRHAPYAVLVPIGGTGS